MMMDYGDDGVYDDDDDYMISNHMTLNAGSETWGNFM
jgi:hypothetical protein